MQALKKPEDAAILWDSAKRVNESLWSCDNFIAPDFETSGTFQQAITVRWFLRQKRRLPQKEAQIGIYEAKPWVT